MQYVSPKSATSRANVNGEKLTNQFSIVDRSTMEHVQRHTRSLRPSNLSGKSSRQDDGDIELQRRSEE